MMFQHYVMTIFNLPVFRKGRKDKNKNRILDDEWYEHRLRLFETFTVASLEAQTRRNFTWIIFVCQRTPMKYFNRINHATRRIKSLIIPTDHTDRYTLGERYLRILDPKVTHLITSRIDNDDAVHVNYIRQIQEDFEDAMRTRPADKFIPHNFFNGYLIDMREHRFYKRFHNSSPFISLFERIENGAPPRSVMCKQHNYIRELGEVYMNERLDGAWLTVVHDRNLGNTVTGDKHGPVNLKRLYGVTYEPEI